MRIALAIFFLGAALPVLATESCFRRLLDAAVQKPSTPAAPEPIDLSWLNGSQKPPGILAQSEKSSSSSAGDLTAALKLAPDDLNFIGQARQADETGRAPAAAGSTTSPAKEENIFAKLAEEHAQRINKPAFNMVDNVPGAFVRVRRPLSQMDNELITATMRNPVNGSFKEAAGVELLDSSGKTIYRTPITLGDEESVEMFELIRNQEFANAFNQLRPAAIRFTHTHPPKPGDLGACENRAIFSPADVRGDIQMRASLDSMGLKHVEIQTAILYIDPEVAVRATSQTDISNAVREKTFIVPSGVPDPFDPKTRR